MDKAQAWQQGWWVTKGGPGSGHHGHKGVPGQQGGSAPRSTTGESTEHPGFAEYRSTTIQGAIKPAARPRYQGNDPEGAIFAAARMSVKYERPMYVYLAHSGYGTSYGITYKGSELKRSVEKFVEVSGSKVRWFAKTWIVEEWRQRHEEAESE